MQETFHTWLKRHHQSEGAISGFWNLITLPTLNDHAMDVSADWAMMVFQQTLLLSGNGGNVGYASDIYRIGVEK